MNEEATITITIQKTGDQSHGEAAHWTSRHQIENIDELMAAVVLFDVGRDLLLLHHHQHEEHAHGDAEAEG